MQSRRQRLKTTTKLDQSRHDTQQQREVQRTGSDSLGLEKSNCCENGDAAVLRDDVAKLKPPVVLDEDDMLKLKPAEGGAAPAPDATVNDAPEAEDFDLTSPVAPFSLGFAAEVLLGLKL